MTEDACCLYKAFRSLLVLRFTALCLRAHVRQKYAWLFQNPGEISSLYKKEYFFCGENSNLVERPSQGCGRALISRGFQDATRQSSR